MTFEQFILKYNGMYVEVAGTVNALYQCTDLGNAYLRDVLNLPIIEWTNAIDYPSKAGNKYDWILNTPEGIPQKGDLVIFNIGQYGHISIFLLGDTNQIITFDQNFPLGSKCALRTHDYSKVVGWLHPIKTPSSPLQPILSDQTVIPDNLTGWITDGKGLEIQQIRGMLGDYLRDRMDLQNTRLVLDQAQQTIERLKKDLAKLKVEREKLEQNLFLARNVSPISTYTLPQETSTTVPKASITVTTAEDDEKPGPEWLTNFFKWLGRKF